MAGRIYTKRYDFPPVKKGNTWLGGRWRLNRDITGWQIRMWLVPPNSTKAIKEFTIGNGITVIDADNGEFQFDKFRADLPAAAYKFDIEFTKPNDIIRTYVMGYFVVYDDIIPKAIHNSTAKQACNC